MLRGSKVQWGKKTRTPGHKHDELLIILLLLILVLILVLILLILIVLILRSQFGSSVD